MAAWALVPLALLLAAPAAGHVMRPDSHAPLGVMGKHMHRAGGIMLSYRYVRASMGGNRDGTSRRSTSDVLRRFPVAPTDMDMEMHVLGVMWAPHDRVTLMGMVPFRRQDMDHRMRRGIRFTARSKGLGDIRVSGLVRLHDDGVHHLHLNAGVSLPTGSISRKDDTPMGRVRLPYPMQLGSGTWDLLPGLTYTGRSERYSWGAQVMGTLRTGRNDKGYRLGNRFEASAWGQRVWTRWLSASLRLAWSDWRNIRGDDDALHPALAPTADPDRRAGERLDGFLGLNLLGTRGPLHNHRFALEIGWPLYQSLDGPQLEQDWQLIAGWQYAF